MRTFIVCTHRGLICDEIETTDYIEAWQLFRTLKSLVSPTHTVDLVDGETGEVFASTSEDF
jgi:hypothetical protein